MKFSILNLFSHHLLLNYISIPEKMIQQTAPKAFVKGRLKPSGFSMLDDTVSSYLHSSQNFASLVPDFQILFSTCHSLPHLSGSFLFLHPLSLKLSFLFLQVFQHLLFSVSIRIQLGCYFIKIVFQVIPEESDNEIVWKHAERKLINFQLLKKPPVIIIPHPVISNHRQIQCIWLQKHTLGKNGFYF